MSKAIGYLRVSTIEQGRSGLGLEAQRQSIESFAEHETMAVVAWYQDVQTGSGADALTLRPGLGQALADGRKRHCPLIVARLDQLSRNVHFISGLMEHKVHFMVAALGKDVDTFTLHIYASLAEQERKMISERTKVAMAAAKLRGTKWGIQCRSKRYRRAFMQLGHAAIQKAANERAEAYRPHIEWVLRQQGCFGGAISLSEAARKLNFDAANRLVSGLIGTGSPQYVYGYDHASNLTAITPDGPTQSLSYTSTNAITSATYDAFSSVQDLSRLPKQSYRESYC